jgi:hypothetical protein
LGKFEDIDPRSLDSEPWRRQCDRECFRAPSEFVGPFVDLFQHPIRLIKKFANDGEHARLWLEDLKYFQACDYFDAMRPPNREKLARHEPRSPATRWADPSPARL